MASPSSHVGVGAAAREAGRRAPPGGDGSSRGAEAGCMDRGAEALFFPCASFLGSTATHHRRSSTWNRAPPASNRSPLPAACPPAASDPTLPPQIRLCLAASALEEGGAAAAPPGDAAPLPTLLLLGSVEREESVEEREGETRRERGDGMFVWCARSSGDR
ncbi:unnamed protein product [Urochloa humidicola]